MHFAEEMEDPKLLKFPAENTAVGKKELELAKQLVGTLKGHFDPEEFENAHHDRLEETIQAKVAAERGKPAKRPQRPQRAQADAKVIDLMERLRQSLEKGGTPAKAGNGSSGSKAAKNGKPARKAVPADREHAHSEKRYPHKKAG